MSRTDTRHLVFGGLVWLVLASSAQAQFWNFWQHGHCHSCQQPAAVAPPRLGGDPADIAPALPGAIPAAPAPAVQPSPAEMPIRLGMQVCPRRVIAPIGSEVVIAAGICRGDTTLRAGETIEWTVSPSGTGQLVSVGEPHGILFDWPVRKVDATYAVSTSSRRTFRLTRGTPTRADDLTILRGQAWASVTSPVEGVTHLTAVSRDEPAWDLRRDSATIYWVDARWQFPPRAVNPAGTPHRLTTVVTKASDNSPIEGWRVRYEIVSGPPAGLGPDGVSMAEIPTNSSGQASVELNQLQPESGVNEIRIQLIRPANAPRSDGQRLVVAEGSTTKTWSSPQLALRKSGPSTATLGATMTYRIEVSNPGDVTANNVVVEDALPPNTSFLNAFPEANRPNPNLLRWDLGELAPRQTRSIELNLRADGQGALTNQARAVADGGLTARDSITTTVTVPALRLQIEGPSESVVGEPERFVMSITNTGDGFASGLLLQVDFDNNLVHEVHQSPIERNLPELAPGETRTVGLTLVPRRPGQLCVTAKVTGAGGLESSQRFCTTAADPPAPPAPRFDLRLESPENLQVGQRGLYSVFLKNSGTEAARDVTVRTRYDVGVLEPVQASRGSSFENNDLVWRVPQLAPNQELIFRVEFEATSARDRSCVETQVTGLRMEPATDEACLRVAASPPPRLQMRLSNGAERVAVGQSITYFVVVENVGQSVAVDLDVDIEIPGPMMFESVGNDNPTGHRLSGRLLSFARMPRLAPGERARWEFTLRGALAGEATVEARLRSARLPEAVISRSRTQVATP